MMKQTVVGVFDRYAQAQHAAQQLRDSGFGDSVFVTEQPADAAAGTASTATQAQEEGVFAQVRNFFSELFSGDDDREVQPYAEAVRRGGAVVKVEVDEESRAEAARNTLLQAGAVDLDKDAQTGMSADTGMAKEPGGASDKTRFSTGTGTGTAPSGMASDEDVIPVVREEMQVGKRTLGTGGVRVYAHTVETPVSESVELRSERATVERRPVDRPASAKDLSGLGERTIEVRETAEQPVVGKQARVVEEVRVGKDVDVKTQEVRDTVRSTQVDVQPLKGETGTADDSDFRTHFKTHFVGTSDEYEDYEPAYRFGQAMRSDSRYTRRQWEDAEPELRYDWESRNPHSSWDRFKAAARHGWERITR
jgi:uncharacterized protein (TIGR02271 family)